MYNRQAAEQLYANKTEPQLPRSASSTYIPAPRPSVVDDIHTIVTGPLINPIQLRHQVERPCAPGKVHEYGTGICGRMSSFIITSDKG
ncbi:hypothetical protein M441DRAFT_59946 [Trichoderma asperellum CBS 433.97]|uniref:Uncharacterized protein n=1 Tax=Trichoderma asperellum (strain ATCC 204424 / CBS 433.97 / NBRC 101777) TaxID=1042311 RepID=A0A2T3Z1N5_TRIA4|nr:hypothetical protein M441DRAFT_59946 [Trichoderma asperellum CBS 433.97]PTB38707.1 hypothetical protein M441DRAFT_59946 [Trichoderma asperellum CBS 433.97]